MSVDLSAQTPSARQVARPRATDGAAPDDARKRSAFVVARTTVQSVERMCPTFARITFAGPDLADFGTPGRVLDQRIKLIFPSEGRPLPALDCGDDWYQSWLAIPERERGTMRTYSIRELRADEAGTTVVVDFVLHLEPGLSGPAAHWAASAQRGDELLLIGPRRGREGGGGIEFAPGETGPVVLAGDETAAPAIARILEDLGHDARGVAFIEVPTARDALQIDHGPGIEVRWLPREGRPHGAELVPAVLAHAGLAHANPAAGRHDHAPGVDLLWETPAFSSLGEDLESDAQDRRKDHVLTERYFWIAGESGVVTTLRRHLVKDLGIDRKRVAFMGYWRKGVAMRG